MTPPPEMVSPIGLTVLNPELAPIEALMECISYFSSIVFVHSLGGHARGLWGYEGPKADRISHG